jgi:hypothetical protein
MFSWFKKLFNKNKKSSCCSKNTCGTPSVWSKPQPYIDTNDSLVDSVVVNNLVNSIILDEGHPISHIWSPTEDSAILDIVFPTCCPSEDSNTSCDSGSSCCSDTVSDGPMPDCSPSCCDSDCSASCDSGSSCCDSGCGSSD